MARRHGRKGEWLATDDYTGMTNYASEMTFDYWGNFVKKPLLRNLQEIASPLNDPRPVPIYRGPTYEYIPNPCIFETQPLFIGVTQIRTPLTSPAAQALNLEPPIPDGVVGCTFLVY